MDQRVSSVSSGQGALRSVTPAVSVAVWPGAIVNDTWDWKGKACSNGSRMFDQRPEQMASCGPVPPGGRVTSAAPVTVISDHGMTLTDSSSGVAPGVGLGVVVAFAGSLPGEPAGAGGARAPGLGERCGGNARRATAAAARAS